MESGMVALLRQILPTRSRPTTLALLIILALRLLHIIPTAPRILATPRHTPAIAPHILRLPRPVIIGEAKNLQLALIREHPAESGVPLAGQTTIVPTPIILRSR